MDTIFRELNELKGTVDFITVFLEKKIKRIVEKCDLKTMETTSTFERDFISLALINHYKWRTDDLDDVLDRLKMHGDLIRTLMKRMNPSDDLSYSLYDTYKGKIPMDTTVMDTTAVTTTHTPNETPTSTAIRKLTFT